MDEYFVSVRLLKYQLQFNKALRSARGIPPLVLVTQISRHGNANSCRRRATLVPVDKLQPNPSGLQIEAKAWQDVLSFASSGDPGVSGASTCYVDIILH
jgi:hypothetical protein